VSLVVCVGLCLLWVESHRRWRSATLLIPRFDVTLESSFGVLVIVIVPNDRPFEDRIGFDSDVGDDQTPPDYLLGDLASNPVSRLARLEFGWLPDAHGSGAPHIGDRLFLPDWFVVSLLICHARGMGIAKTALSESPCPNGLPHLRL
jgi:hypothetical protein